MGANFLSSYIHVIATDTKTPQQHRLYRDSSQWPTLLPRSRSLNSRKLSLSLTRTAMVSNDPSNARRDDKLQRAPTISRSKSHWTPWRVHTTMHAALIIRLR